MGLLSGASPGGTEISIEKVGDMFILINTSFLVELLDGHLNRVLGMQTTPTYLRIDRREIAISISLKVRLV